MPAFYFRLVLWINILYGVTVLVTPSYIYSMIFSPYLLTIVAACALGIYISVKAVINRERDAAFSLIGILLLSAGAIIDCLCYLQITYTRYVLSAALVCFIVIQVVLLAKRYSSSLCKAERLSSELEISLDRITKTETAYLSAQIKPHFLFNSLNVIASLSVIDAVKTRALLLDFSEYLRYSFDFKNSEKPIAFSDELKAVQAYVRIEQARFPGQIEIEYALCDEDFSVPQFILQPLVENAIRHGLHGRFEKGKVVVRTRKLAGGYEITVMDDGVGMTPEQLKIVRSGSFRLTGGIGLVNIQKRLTAEYGTELRIESALGEGTVVSLLIPDKRPRKDGIR